MRYQLPRVQAGDAKWHREPQHKKVGGEGMKMSARKFTVLDEEQEVETKSGLQG